MAPGQEPVSFDAIIQADRQKRKNEELANKILGKNRKASAPVSKAGRKAGSKAQSATPGSLASRIGVTKRSASATFEPKKNNRVPSAPVVTNSRPGNKRRPDENRLVSALNPASGQATIREKNPAGMTIRGAGSGSVVVIGSNFAPGTTAADIQSALEPVSGKILNCWITSQHPIVMAEIAFSERWSAENAIANFHNQKADGRVLSMRLKQQPSSTIQSSFNDIREQADRERRLNRGADPAVQNGSFGFSEQNNQALDRDDVRGGRNNSRRDFRGNRTPGRGGRHSNQDTQETGLYSDEMMVDAPPRGPRNRGRGNRQR